MQWGIVIAPVVSGLILAASRDCFVLLYNNHTIEEKSASESREEQKGKSR